MASGCRVCGGANRWSAALAIGRGHAGGLSRKEHRKNKLLHLVGGPFGWEACKKLPEQEKIQMPVDGGGVKLADEVYIYADARGYSPHFQRVRVVPATQHARPLPANRGGCPRRFFFRHQFSDAIKTLTDNAKRMQTPFGSAPDQIVTRQTSGKPRTAVNAHHLPNHTAPSRSNIVACPSACVAVCGYPRIA